MQITIIGAGNVGSHLARALHGSGHTVAQIYSRQLSNARGAAKPVNAQPIDRLSAVSPNTQLCLLSVKDDAIGSVAATVSQYLPEGAIIAHTSGATPATALSAHWPHFGVFYPLQTLSKNQPADFDHIPLCIDGASPGIQQVLLQLARSISSQVYLVDDEQRAILHLAAVFINNFTNAMLQAGHTLTQEAQLPQGILKPLLHATIEKGSRYEPRTVQTGPAIRSDQQTIERHLGQLANHPELSAVYKAITAYIKTF
ncbi:MAG: DUF2520 domain-containing protein [Phaeodactylibacter sp.]|uniref:Rossmann-like and DUF2520 domain-containing protein n=1 Tax=Phaeodactylibacter sp. TaxID=1940289 RepID=UPI0032EBD8BE